MYLLIRGARLVVITHTTNSDEARVLIENPLGRITYSSQAN